MKLTENQMRVLSAIEFDARATAKEISKATGLREHVARFARDFLVSKELCEPYLMTNPAAMGLTDFAVYIRRGMSAAERDTFVRFIKQSKRCTWLAELSGNFQFCFSFLGKNFGELDEFLIGLSERCSSAYEERHIAPRLQCDVYPHKFLYDGFSPKWHISWSANSDAVKLDDVDKQVLKEVCTHPDKPVSYLARLAKIAGSSFQYRLDSLMRDGVILGFPNYVNYNALGIRKYMLLVYEQKPLRPFRKKFEAFCAKHPHVTTCLRSMSEWTYEVDVEVLKTADLSSVKQEMFDLFPSAISKIESMEYLTTHKMKPYPGIFDL